MKQIDPIRKYILTLLSIFRTNIRDYGMYIALIVIFVIFSILTNGVFLRPMNFTNLLNQTAYVSVLAVGMTLVIVTRQIDLSVGYLGAFLGAFVVVGVEITYPEFLAKITNGAMSAQLMSIISIIIAIILALVITVGVGALKGFLVAKVKVPSFVVTLAGMFVFKGLLMIKTNNRTIPTSNTFFDKIGVGYLSNFKIGNMDGLTLILGSLLMLLVIVFSFIKREKNVRLGIKVEPASLFATKVFFILGIIFLLM